MPLIEEHEYEEELGNDGEEIREPQDAPNDEVPDETFCVYCKKDKRTTKLWKETSEQVCYDCRQEIMEDEFEKEFPDFWKLTLADTDSPLGDIL